MDWTLFADLGDVAGARTVTVPADGPRSARSALEALLAEHPELEQLIDHLNDLPAA